MIKYICIPYVSARDRNGNTYHAFKLVNCSNRRETEPLIQDTDGAGFRSQMLEDVGIDTREVYFTREQVLPYRQFKAFTKGCLYANTRKGQAALGGVK